MKTAIIAFEISSYWHAGTGRGSGPLLDAVVFRSPGGLPMLPGRTVRGLLRDAFEYANRTGAIDSASFEGSATTWCFGTGLDEAIGNKKDHEERDYVYRLEEARFKTRPGNLEIDSAVLGKTPDEANCWEDWALRNAGKLDHLFRRISSTKIDVNGLADAHTLRSIEVAVPLTLHASVRGPKNGPRWWEALREVLPFIRGIGSHRNRGLGRVEVSLVEGCR